MHYLLNRDHQHHKWRLQKYWISYQDCQDAQDKQRTQYLLIFRSKWKMLQNCCNFQSQNVQIFGFVYHNTNGLNHGPAWKTQSFLLSEICAVILRQDYYGKGNSRKFYWNTDGKKFRIGNAYSLIEKRTILVCVCGRYQTRWIETEHLSDLENPHEDVDLGEPTSKLDHVYLGCTQGEWKISKDIVDNSQRSLQELQENYPARWNLMRTYLHGLVTWEVMQRNTWKDIANFRTKPSSNRVKFQLHALMTVNSKKKNGDLWENCQKFALKSSWSVCTWQASVDLNILWSANKLARANTICTRACDERLARLISYVHLTSEFEQYCHVGNNAKQCRLGLFQNTDFTGGDLEDSKSTSGESCVCSAVTHFFPQVGCVRNRLLFHTVRRNLKSFLSMQLCAWMAFPLSIIGYWSVSFFLQSKTETRRVSAGRPAAQQAVKQTHHHPNQDSDTERRSWVVHCRSCLRKREILSSCCNALHILKDNEAVIKNDHEKQESNDETRVPNPQSCVGLVVRQNWSWP